MCNNTFIRVAFLLNLISLNLFLKKLKRLHIDSIKLILNYNMEKNRLIIFKKIFFLLEDISTKIFG